MQGNKRLDSREPISFAISWLCWNSAQSILTTAWDFQAAPAQSPRRFSFSLTRAPIPSRDRIVFASSAGTFANSKAVESNACVGGAIEPVCCKFNEMLGQVSESASNILPRWPSLLPLESPGHGPLNSPRKCPHREPAARLLEHRA